MSLFLCLTAASGGGLSFENLNTNMQMVKRYLNIYIFNSYIFVIFVAKDDLEYADGQFMQRTLLARLPLGILSVTCILPNGESRPAYYSKIQIQNNTNIQIQILILHDYKHNNPNMETNIVAGAQSQS